MDLKQCKLYKGDAEAGTKVDTTLTVDDQDMIDIVSIVELFVFLLRCFSK